MDRSGIRDVEAARHHVWRYSTRSWLVLVVVPTAYAAMRWQLGIGHDPDMNGVGELVAQFVVILTVPMAALAFAVFAPLAIGIDYLLDGRTTRLVNLVIGAVLGSPALVIAVLVGGWPEQSVSGAIDVIRHPERAPAFFAVMPLAGIIVGLGMRHAHPARQA